MKAYRLLPAAVWLMAFIITVPSRFSLAVPTPGMSFTIVFGVLGVLLVMIGVRRDFGSPGK